MRHAMVSSQTLTVGCGVFAVRAKISPPVVTMRRGGVCSDVACRVAILSILPVAAFIFLYFAISFEMPTFAGD